MKIDHFIVVATAAIYVLTDFIFSSAFNDILLNLMKVVTFYWEQVPQFNF
jgi:hypothetical protein